MSFILVRKFVVVKVEHWRHVGRQANEQNDIMKAGNSLHAPLFPDTIDRKA